MNREAEFVLGLAAKLTFQLKRIAVPMIGGMVSSTVLTPVVIAAIYARVKGWRPPSS